MRLPCTLLESRPVAAVVIASQPPLSSTCTCLAYAAVSNKLHPALCITQAAPQRPLQARRQVLPRARPGTLCSLFRTIRPVPGLLFPSRAYANHLHRAALADLSTGRLISPWPSLLLAEATKVPVPSTAPYRRPSSYTPPHLSHTPKEVQDYKYFTCADSPALHEGVVLRAACRLSI